MAVFLVEDLTVGSRAKVRFIMFVGIIFLCINLGGCMEIGRKDLQNELIEYMKEKYGEDFSYVSPYGGKIGDSSRTIIVNSEIFPGKKILVCKIKNENGKDFYQDNYMAYVLHDAAKEKIRNIMECVYNSAVLVFPVPLEVLPDADDCSYTLDEYLSSADSMINLNILIGTEDIVEYKDEKLKKLAQMLAEQGILTYGTVAYVKDDVVLGEISEENIQEYWNHEDWYYARGDFAADLDGNITYIEWR